jgi:hypothetical protein
VECNRDSKITFHPVNDQRALVDALKLMIQEGERLARRADVAELGARDDPPPDPATR